jgi:uncharacterized protein
MAFLLDVNVLIALIWRGHPHHQRVQNWFGRNAGRGWATCPFTQAALVRIVSNPAFSARAVSPLEALSALTTTLKHPAHRFWSDDIPLVDAVRDLQDGLIGHQQVTDAYLLGLALHKKGKLATLDRGILDLLPSGSPQRESVELIAELRQ